MAEKKNVQNLKWATAHLSRRLGRRRGRWAGRTARRARGARRRAARHGPVGARQGEQQACAGRAASGERRACVAVVGSMCGSGRQGARLGARSAQGTAGWQHGRAACAHGLGQLGARAPGLVFSLVFRLGIFSESLNEHCSL